MPKLINLLMPFRNCEGATAMLLRSMKVPYTHFFLQKELTEHRDYPSLMSIADVLGSSYNIASVALKITYEQILMELKIKPPFVAHIKTSSGSSSTFSVITKMSNQQIELYDPEPNSLKTLTPSKFKETYLGTILVVEGERGKSIEKNFEENFKKEKQLHTLLLLFLGSLPLITGLSCIKTLLTDFNVTNLFACTFILLSLLGGFISIILVGHDIDQYNPIIQQICQATNKKTNCTVVLNSKAAKIFGFSFSSIGFSYFLGILILLLSTGITNRHMLELISYLSILALPYTVFSIYYQWRVVKQWCKLCLLVQGIILVQAAISLIENFNTFVALNSIPLTYYFSVLIVMILVFTSTQLSILILLKLKESRRKSSELQRFKRDPKIFEALLKKERKVELPTNDLGIIIGNPNGRFRLLKICNPYCSPCAKAHVIIEELLDASDELCVQILFTATEDDRDYRKHPVSHFLALDMVKKKKEVREALDDWYRSHRKDYNTFSERYSVPEELKLQNSKISKMREWCDKALITFTPTIFLSIVSDKELTPVLYQLPDTYSLTELKYLLTN